jgi:hypothetical protein
MPVPAAELSWYERLVSMSTRPGSTEVAIFAAAALFVDEDEPLDDPFEGVVLGKVKFPKPGMYVFEFDVVGDAVCIFVEEKT